MNKKAALLFTIGLLMLMLLSACSAAATPSPSIGFAPNEAPAAPAPIAGQASKAADSFNVSNATGMDAVRLVIRNADLNIVVKNPGTSMDTISRMAADMGGFVVSSHHFKTTNPDGIDFPQADITIRVPIAKLNDALDKIKAEVTNKDTDILSENVTGQDVTKEYTDQTSRLTNLLNTEKQLQKIMDQATKTEDVLAVYNQLVSVREQIEITKGQIKYFEESAAMSAITVHLQSQAAIKPITIAGWKPIGVASKAIQALVDTLQFIGNALIWIILYVLPVGLVLVAIFLVLRFFLRKVIKPRKPKQIAPTQPVPPAPPADPQA